MFTYNNIMRALKAEGGIPDYWYAQFTIDSGTPHVGLTAESVSVGGVDDILYKIRKSSANLSTSLVVGAPTFAGSSNLSAQSSNGNVILGTKDTNIHYKLRYISATDTWDTYSLPDFGTTVSFDYCNGYFYFFYPNTTGGIRRIKDDFTGSLEKVSSVACAARQMVYHEQLNLYIIPTGIDGVVLYSNDGVNWLEGTSSVNAQYCAAGEDKIILTSAGSGYWYTVDGVNYVPQLLPVESSGEIVYAQGKFVIPLKSNTGMLRICYSETGLLGSWIIRNIAATAHVWSGRVYYSKNSDIFIAFVDGGFRVFYSRDLDTWALLVDDSPSALAAYEIYGGVAVARASSNIYYINAYFDTGDNIKVWHDKIAGDIYSKLTRYNYNDAAQSAGTATHWYELNTDSNDSVGAAHGTNTDITYSNGGAVFNGTTSKITLPSSVYTAQWRTLEVVFDLNNPLNSILFNLRNAAAATLFDIRIFDNGDIYYRVFTDAIYTASAASKIVANKKYYAAITYNSTTGEILGYLDGELVAQATTAVAGNHGTGTAAAIGYFIDYNDAFVNGTIYDLKLHSTTLTPAQIKANALAIGLYDGQIETEYTGVTSDLKPASYDPADTTLDTTSIITTNPDANDWQPYGTYDWQPYGT